MPAFRDRSGQTFGHLTAIRLDSKGSDGRNRWECVCSCGEMVTVRGSDMSPHRTTSCGCVQREAVRKFNVSPHKMRHGHARAKKPSPTWVSWKNMIERCCKPYAPNRKYYGDIGVSVCDRWLGKDGFSNFLADIGERPRGMTLDRLDSRGNYEPSNVRWATAKTQRRNRRVPNCLQSIIEPAAMPFSRYV